MISFKIGNSLIGNNSKPFIIAELSANHGNSLKKCLKLVKAAKNAGASAIKLQTYKPETITLNSNKDDFKIKKNSPWKNYKNLWKLYSSAFTPWGWHEHIFEEAKKNNLEYFSSPFDESSVDFLNKLNVKAFKIASAEINHLPMIEKIIHLNKPIIFSLGFASKKNLNDIITLTKKYKFKKIIFLNCVSNYPALSEEYSFYDIDNLKKNYLVGLSDHTLGNEISSLALAKGACVFEKHLCINGAKSVDNFFSSNFDQFKRYVNNINKIHQIINNKKSNLSINKDTLNKRSIYVSKDINIGEKFSKNNITIVRPGNSLDPSKHKYILDKRAKKKLSLGDRINLKDVK